MVDAIANIARGILEPAMARVETVLASLLPLAIDLLARLLGLGNVGAKVREIIEKVQGFVDRAIDGLLNRVLAAFRGGTGTGPAEPKTATEAAPQADAEVTPGADPAVKIAALDDVQRRLLGKDLQSLADLRSILAETFKVFQPRGLKALDVDVLNEATMDVAISASASEPERRTMKWQELFAAQDPAQESFRTQPRNETHAVISVNGNRLGAVVKSDKDRHAEENLIAAHWQRALARARQSVDKGQPTTIAVAINRAPCHLTCTPLLIETLGDVEQPLKDQVRFILAPTGTYEPTEQLTPEAVEKQRKELEQIALRLGRPASAVYREQLAKVRLTEDTTTFKDLMSTLHCRLGHCAVASAPEADQCGNCSRGSRAQGCRRSGSGRGKEISHGHKSDEDQCESTRPTAPRFSACWPCLALSSAHRLSGPAPIQQSAAR